MRFGQIQRQILALILIFSIIHSFNITTSGLNTESDVAGYEVAETRLPISIKLWGYNDYLSIKSHLQNNLPSQINHEYNDNINSKNKLYFFNVQASSYIMQYNLEIEYQEKGSISEMDTLHNAIWENRTERFNLPLNQIGVNEAVTGIEFEMKDLQNYLKTSNTDGKYTIHFLDLADYDGILGPGSKHWFNLGSTLSLKYEDLDLRSIGLVGDRGIFFDTSAFAPYFGFDKSGDYSGTNLRNSLVNDTITLIEKLIIGSPSSNNFLASESEIHIAQLYLGVRTGTKFRIFKDNLIHSIFKNATHELLSYYDINYSLEIFNPINYNRITDLFEENLETINGNPVIIVDSYFIENLKNLIREFVYHEEDRPRKYFYAAAVYSDHDNTTFYKRIDQKLVPYTVEELGLGLTNLNQIWPSSEIYYKVKENDVQSIHLNLFGKMIGLTQLDDNLTAQIESPLSSYGLTSSWDGYYTNLETEALARRLGKLFYRNTINAINNFKNEVKNSVIFWADTSGLDKAEVQLIQGQIHYLDMNYSKAMKYFVKGHQMWLHEVDRLVTLHKLIYHGIIFLVSSLILLYIMYVLKNLSITKSEFKEKLNNLQNK